MSEQLEQQYIIKFYQKSNDAQVETIQKIQQVLGDNSMRITQILKMAAHRWTAEYVPVSSQQAEMMRLSSTCRLWS